MPHGRVVCTVPGSTRVFFIGYLFSLQGEGFLVVGEVAKELSDVGLVGVQ